MRPASTSSFVTVLIETPQIRDTERIDEPSQSIVRIWTRVMDDIVGALDAENAPKLRGPYKKRETVEISN
jgi:hypothetical protein